MLDELVKFARARSPAFAEYSVEDVTRTLEALAKNIFVVTDEAGRIRLFAIAVVRGTRLHFTALVTDGKRQDNFATIRRGVQALKKEVEFLREDGSLRVLKCHKVR